MTNKVSYYLSVDITPISKAMLLANEFLMKAIADGFDKVVASREQPYGRDQQMTSLYGFVENTDLKKDATEFVERVHQIAPELRLLLCYRNSETNLDVKFDSDCL